MVEQLADLARTLALGAAVYCVLIMQGRGRRSHTFVQSYGSDKSSAPVTDRHRQEKTRPTNPLEGDTFIAMSDAPEPTAKPATEDARSPYLQALAEKYGDLTDNPHTVVFQPPPDDRYLTPKTSRA